MTKRAKKHKELVVFEKSCKKSKRGCEKWGKNYKESLYCLGIKDNYAREIYPCLKYVK